MSIREKMYQQCHFYVCVCVGGGWWRRFASIYVTMLKSLFIFYLYMCVCAHVQKLNRIIERHHNIGYMKLTLEVIRGYLKLSKKHMPVLAKWSEIMSLLWSAFFFSDNTNGCTDKVKLIIKIIDGRINCVATKQLHLVVTWAEKDDILGGTDLQVH